MLLILFSALQNLRSQNRQFVAFTIDSLVPSQEFWVVTEPIDVEVEKRVRRIRHSLYEMFPDSQFEFHLINPRLSESFDLGVFVPEDAILVLMH